MKRCAVAVLILLALACASPERKAREARQSVASWAATGEMLAQEWMRGSVSDRYARSTARVAIEELQALDAPARDAAIRAWRDLEDAVARNDQTAAERTIAAFDHAARASGASPKHVPEARSVPR
jgi:hypothetical protein